MSSDDHQSKDVVRYVVNSPIIDDSIFSYSEFPSAVSSIMCLVKMRQQTIVADYNG